MGSPRTLRDELDQVRLGALPEDRLDLSGDVPRLEAVQLEPLDGPLLLPASRHTPERMRAMQLVGAHGEYEQQPATTGPRDEQR